MAGWAHACLRSLGLAANQSKCAEQLEAERCAVRFVGRQLLKPHPYPDAALPARCSHIGLINACHITSGLGVLNPVSGLGINLVGHTCEVVYYDY